ncbi:(5-formylfuran-3-yl)methyl phosphate synthase [Chthonobacter rhizosphaerae]|uniref:(5-formylfuran-3-yl)methyl phosphate synthase n=1 Tax=Chthonobacter rhizosphaerae TaxID=2735553 RepID=UPI0015EEC5DD|nr:(5-formylfuran-3-yl)methyl phosphate synthase [Chthonobacter rhizosphaerae]
MTELLVSVTSPEEAIAALDAGATVIDLKDPAAGALGAVPVETARAIVAAVGHRGTLTAAAGDAATVEDARALYDAGVVTVKVPIPAGDAGAKALSVFGAALGGTARLVAVFAADQEPDAGLVPVAAFSGFSGVMLDTTAKTGGLLDVMELADIAQFVAAARRAKLMVGLAGSLKVVDVGTLLPLKPDVIGFRGGVCVNGIRTNPLDPARVRAAATALAVHAVRRETAE